VYGAGPGAGTAGASALRAPKVGDVAVCAAAGGTLATAAAWGATSPVTRAALAAAWAVPPQVGPGAWPPAAGTGPAGALAAARVSLLTPAEVEAAIASGQGWDPPGHVAAATACLRVLAPNGTAITVVVPMDGRLVPAVPPSDPYPHSGGTYVPPASAPVCAFYGHPLCELKDCVPGVTSLPGSETLVV
jgi:hypothetical protein